MKKIIACFIIVIFSTVFLCGCNGDVEDPDGLTGDVSNFYGIWTESSRSDTFTLGDSIQFYEDLTCRFFWSDTGNTRATGNWERRNVNFENYILVITVGEKETIYKFDFFDKYQTLRLKEQNSTTYMIFRKQ